MFRKANINDVDDIMQIIDDAKISLKNMNIDQWQNGYPDCITIKEDILKSISYVFCDSSDKKNAIASVSFDGESTYDNIYNGQWLSTEKFLVIHRFATKNDVKRNGIASTMMNYIKELAQLNNVKSIKIDTHKNNIPMRKFLEKNDFKYCGIILLNDGNERAAYEFLKIDK
ncbi:MAG: GNAT family N-acetyltransferase [Sarcina sp.]